MFQLELKKNINELDSLNFEMMTEVGWRPIIHQISHKLFARYEARVEIQRETSEVVLIVLNTVVSTVPISVAIGILESFSSYLTKGLSLELRVAEVPCPIDACSLLSSNLHFLLGVREICLNILTDILKTYGNLLVPSHDLMLGALLPLLSSDVLRRNTILCIASLASHMSEHLLSKASKEVVRLLKDKAKYYEIKLAAIQMVGALSGAVGDLFGPHLGDIVPLLISYCYGSNEDEEENEYEIMYSMHSLQALESILLLCPTTVTPYCDPILHAIFVCLNYCSSITENIEEDCPDSYVDEDVIRGRQARYAAAKCLARLIESRPEMLSRVYMQASKLIERFNETEVDVKMQVFRTFIALLRETGNARKGQAHFDEQSPRSLLMQYVPNIVGALKKELRGKSIDTMVGAFSVLKELAIVLPNILAVCIEDVILEIRSTILDESSTSELKIEALGFIGLALANSSGYYVYVKVFLSPVMDAVYEPNHGVKLEALKVCAELICIVGREFKSDTFNDVSKICSAISSCLTDSEYKDQHVGNCAIHALGLLVSTCGDRLNEDLVSCLDLLMAQMSYEEFQLTTVEAFTVIASSSLNIDLSSVMQELTSISTTYIDMAIDSALKDAFLRLLTALSDNHAKKIGPDEYQPL